MIHNAVRFLSSLFLLFFVLAGQSSAADTPDKVIKLATTTSTDNSGLLAYLLPKFSKDTGYQVHVIAVGTGKALRMGQDGDVDIVLVHARPAEDKFVAEGYGEQRYGVMYNDFVIVGPKDDPAHIADAKDAAAALAAIARTQSIFVSRGDDSGTNKKELRLWKAAGIKPEGSWYREAGQGMGKVLQISGEMGAYTLTDRGTWLAFQDKLPLRIDYQGDAQLFNPYGIIAVNPKRHPDTNYQGALALIGWIISPEGQKLIGDFRIGDTRLFTPSATPEEFAAFSKAH